MNCIFFINKIEVNRPLKSSLYIKVLNVFWSLGIFPPWYIQYGCTNPFSFPPFLLPILQLTCEMIAISNVGRIVQSKIYTVIVFSLVFRPKNFKLSQLWGGGGKITQFLDMGSSQILILLLFIYMPPVLSSSCRMDG